MAIQNVTAPNFSPVVNSALTVATDSLKITLSDFLFV